MTAELWQEKTQYAKETTAGTGVAATRVAYLRDVSLTKERESRPHRFATGTRDNVRAFTQGSVVAGGSLAFPMSADEILEWLLIGLKGGVTPTTPGGGTLSRLWTFVPGATALDSMTLERHDGAAIDRLLGVRANSIKIAGSVAGENLVTCELFATDLDESFSALTGSLAERVPTFLEGWQTNMYLTAFAGTPGASQVTDALIAWEVTIANNLQRQYLANNTLAAAAVNTGALDITANLTLAGGAAATIQALTDWAADTKKLLRLEFLGPVDGIEAGFRRFVTIDLPGAWTNPSRDMADAAARARGIPLTYVYDPTNAFGVQVRVQNARTAAFA